VAFRVAASAEYHTKICFSFDFAVAPFNTQSVIAILQRYSNLPGHFRYQGCKGQGTILVSTFDGPASTHVDWVAVKAAVPNLCVVPHLSIDEVRAKPLGIDGAINWNAWATRDNKPINGNASTVDDHIMQDLLGANKVYGTLVSPWSFTNFHNNGVDKVWVFGPDVLLVQRWQQMLAFETSKPGAHIDLVEIYSWNDYGESNYHNPIGDAHADEFAGGDDAWCKSFKHDGWRYMHTPFIHAFKNHHASVSECDISSEIITMQHRPYPADTVCAGQSTPIPGASFLPDQVTIFSAVKAPVEIQVTSGDTTTKLSATAGVQANKAPMKIGRQSMIVTRNGKRCGAVTSSIAVTSSCTSPNYNVNVEYVVLNC
jgi:glucan endo-1,3-alpha-glucosidase